MRYRYDGKKIGKKCCIEQNVITVDAEPFFALSSPLARSVGGADEGRGSQ
jgi:hypothetical protein